MKYILIICTVLAISCTDEKCDDGEVRCEDNIEQVCVSDDWLDWTDCSKFYSVDTEQKEEEWVCCEFSIRYLGPGCDLKEFCEEEE